MSNIIKFIRGAEADIPVLNQGEPAFTTDTHKVFIGDGAGNHQLAMLSDTQNKLNWIYPQDYATGTGTLVDPWAGSCIEDSLTACPAGGTIYLRAGYYQLAGTATITKTVNIIGEGINKTIIVTAGGTTTALYADGIDHITMKNFTIDGDAQTLDSEYQAVIGFDDCDYIFLDNIEAMNGGYYGIDYFEGSYSIFQNLYLHDNFRHGLHPGSDISTSNMYNTYKNLYCWNNGVDGFSDRGADVAVQLNNTWDNIQAWDNGEHGIRINTQIGGSLSNSSANGNTVNGIWLYDCHNMSIDNCSCILNEASGVELDSCSNINLTNVISKNNRWGFMMGTGYTSLCSNIMLTVCQFYDDKETPTQDCGIYLEGNHTGISLINCKLTPNENEAITIGSGSPVINSVNGIINGQAAVAGDIMYHDGTSWVRLAKGTANQRLKMNAEATAPEWDTLTEADISDLGAYIGSLIEDPAPELGGDLDAADKYITGAGRISFTQELDNGSKTASFSIYFITDQKQKVTLTANTMTLTLDTTSMGVGNYLLKIVNGGLATLTWASESGSIYFPGGTDPVLTASGTDIVAFYFDGTNWYGMASLDFK